jgi:hypothetical protein
MGGGNLIAGDFPGRYGNGVCRGIFVRGNPVKQDQSPQVMETMTGE